MTTAITGVSSGMIGAITGFYFNKEQLNPARLEQHVQGERAASYADGLQLLQLENGALTDLLNEVVRFLQRAEETISPDAEI